MTQIKYRYCIDENNNLVCIDDLTDATRHEHKWCCLGCEQEMVANLGRKKTWYFSHKANTVCNGESYLHELAKRRICEKFLSAKFFPITFVRDVLCNQRQQCTFFNDSSCQEKDISIPYDLKYWEGETLYDDCQKEITVGEFRPDLLLTSLADQNREKIFIEIYKTHKSEEQKVKSKYKIIETTQIKSEDDIEDIIKRGFVEGQNCQIFNFNPPKLPSIRKTNVPIDRFILFRSGAAIVRKSHEYDICCDKLNTKIDSNSICELNMKEFGIEFWGENAHNKTLDSYESGLIYLVKKKNWLIKNCILCKFRKYNEWRGEHICIRYKSLGPQYRTPKQKMAQNCHYFQIDPKKMSYPLSELEDIILEVPT